MHSGKSITVIVSRLGRFLKGWVEHMRAGQMMFPVLEGCLKQSVWPYDYENGTAWFKQWIGEEASNPQARAEIV